MNQVPNIHNTLFFGPNCAISKLVNCVCLGMVSIEMFPQEPIKPKNNSYTGVQENKFEKQLSII